MSFANTEEAREYARCNLDFAYFVDTYCVIYDKDTGRQFIPFKLWQGQRWLAWILVTLRMVLILKARQLGISWLIAAYCAWKCLFMKGFTAVVISKNDDEAVEFVNRVRYILAQLPDWLRPEVGGPDHHLKILGPGKRLEAEVIAKAQGANAGRSLTASLVVLDEFAFQHYARQIWRAAFPVFYRPTGGQVFILSTMQLGTMFAELCRDAIRQKGDGMTAPFFAFLPWWVHPERTASWYQVAAAQLKEDIFSEFPATPEEAFRTKTGRVVPEYEEQIHFIDPFRIEPEWGWRWFTARDPGSTAPTALVLVAVDPKGRLYFVDELYMPSARIGEVVAAEKKMRERWGLEPALGGMRSDTDLIDPAAAAKKSQEIAADLELYREEMRKAGVPDRLLAANNEPGIYRLRERFTPYKVPDDSPRGWHWEAGAYVFKNCPHLNEQLVGLVWDEPKFEGENVTTWTGPDHAFDCARYISNHLPPPGKGPKPPEKSVVAQAKERALQAARRAAGPWNRRRGGVQ